MSDDAIADLRVMIVEDNSHMAVILRTILQSFGVRELLEARDAASAFEICRSSYPDLALVDYELGDITGIEFTRFIRQADDSPNPFLPIILVTAHSERSRVLEAINAGVNEFIVKPLSAQALYERLRALVERPRPFVKAPGYFGPDRRRRSDPRYKGPKRRQTDSPSGADGHDSDTGTLEI